MTTAQIIIITILFVFDFWLSIIRAIYRDKENPDMTGAIISMLRIMFIYGIAISVTIALNQEREISKGKCPEFEQIQEPVFKKK